jgi:hypothetical protein
VGQAVGDTAGNWAKTAELGNWGQQMASSVASGVSGGLIRAATYNKGKIDWSAIAADAFGNAFGNSIVGEMQESADAIQRAYADPSRGLDVVDPDQGIERPLTVLPSQPLSWADNTSAVAEQTLARAQQGVADNQNGAQALDPLRPPPITVGKGDSYWKLTGGNVAEIGMLIALNGRRNSTIYEGETLNSGSLSEFSEQQVKEFEALGRAVLRQDNARLAQLAEARLQAETGSELRRLQSSAIGEQNARYAAANARGAIDAATHSGRDSMNEYWSGVADAGVSEGSFLKYLAGRTMQFAGNVGYSLAGMSIAADNDPEQALAGGYKSIVNFGPEAFNAAANLGKTSLNGYTMLAEQLGSREGTFAGFRETAAYNIKPLLGYDNEAQAGGALLTQVALGAGLAKYGSYNIELNVSSAGTLYSNPRLITLSPRTTPGVVTYGDDLVAVSGRWLDASVPTPIPLQVARQLEGQTFSRFDELRSAIWRAIDGDPALNAGFGQAARAQMAIGHAPFSPRAYQMNSSDAGMRFNLHHVETVASGGPVYDLSNLRIVSPKIHYGIHN